MQISRGARTSTWIRTQQRSEEKEFHADRMKKRHESVKIQKRIFTISDVFVTYAVKNN